MLPNSRLYGYMGSTGKMVMLDGWARRRVDPLVGPVAALAARTGLPANAITVAACAVGLAAAVAIAESWFVAGLVLILVSRFADALDGAVARIGGKATDLGGYLDIVLDFVFYGAVPMGFVVADPANAVPGAALILSFYVNGSSFLAYAIIAERRKLATGARGAKSLYFTTGLTEATETIAAFALACLFPAWFPLIAWIFAAATAYTAVSRIVLAARTFG